MNVRLLIAYDGTDFRGLAPNPGVRTVVGEIRALLANHVGYEPELVMSGRTDAGVHAWGQILSADLPDDADLGRIQRSVNSKLGPEIVLRAIESVDDDFSARFSATGRTYRYHVVNRDVPDPFLARTSWWVPHELSIDAMRAATEHFVGEHDFSSFCRRPKVADDQPELSLVRIVRSAEWTSHEPGDLLRFTIEGSAFCHQMVRSIVGFLVAVGRGKRQPDDVVHVLVARDRAGAEEPAPPNGLTLWDVDYSDARVGPALS